MSCHNVHPFSQSPLWDPKHKVDVCDDLHVQALDLLLLSKIHSKFTNIQVGFCSAYNYSSLPIGWDNCKQGTQWLALHFLNHTDAVMKFLCLLCVEYIEALFTNKLVVNIWMLFFHMVTKSLLTVKVRTGTVGHTYFLLWHLLCCEPANLCYWWRVVWCLLILEVQNVHNLCEVVHSNIQWFDGTLLLIICWCTYSSARSGYPSQIAWSSSLLAQLASPVNSWHRLLLSNSFLRLMILWQLGSRDKSTSPNCTV